MNPFALPGPDFLEVFGGLSLLVVLAILGLRLLLGPGGRPPRRVTDPYAIALLRGGTLEAIRVGAMSLVRRDLLRCSGRNLHAKSGALDQVRDEAERGIVIACLKPIEGCRLLHSPSAQSGFALRQRELELQGLAPDARLRQTYRLLAGAGLLVLGSLGLGKLLVALSSGHASVFLIALMMAAAASLISLLVRLPPATPRGRTLLAELQALFGSLRHHAVADRPDESLFLAAVFGAAALSAADRAVMQGAFKPLPQNRDSSSCGSSGCGSGGGGGGGCGGGGCGGCGGGG